MPRTDAGHRDKVHLRALYRLENLLG